MRSKLTHLKKLTTNTFTNVSLLVLFTNTFEKKNAFKKTTVIGNFYMVFEEKTFGVFFRDTHFQTLKLCYQIWTSINFLIENN